MLSSLIAVVIFFGIMWLLIIRPQKKQQKEQEEMIAQLKPGASIMTTGGFYGVVLDIVDDTVIVEFGNNKNCRIPMNKAAIAQVDKPEAEVKAEEAAEEDGKEKKKLSLGKKKED
ncbi:MAG: preprotein translocase subunit YajC [Clostridium sp.]|nr:preprotein translocase subunit YajC [Clostridium sp.]